MFSYVLFMMDKLRIRFFLLFVSFVFPICACSKEDSASEIEAKADVNDSCIIEEVPIVSDENGWDIPANEGVKNALLNAAQLVNITYSPIADFYRVGGVFQAGTSIKGIVYSSTRAEDLLVPNNVSLWTYISSLKNPNSYPYTIDISKPPYNIRGYAKPFYGQVCSSFVQYALGIKENFQILQMTIWDGFDKIEPLDIDSIRLGDIFITLKRHTKMVTGIHRVDNHVVELAISEGNEPCALTRVYPVQHALNLLNNGYELYRYRYISNTKHVQSPFVCVGDEKPLVLDEDDMPVDFIVPRRGDKANWRKDEPVIIDVLSREGYSKYKVYRDGAMYKEASIPSDNVIDLGVLPLGSYRLCLANDNEDSRFTYWIVADYAIAAASLGNKKVKISFSSKNAKPVWATWRRPADEDSNYNDGPQWTTVIYDSDRKKGYVISELAPIIEEYYGLGKWDFKVAFETQYGIISSDAVTEYVY